MTGESRSPRREQDQDEDGVVDGAAKAAEDIAEDFLGLEPKRDPTPGPPKTIKD